MRKLAAAIAWSVAIGSAAGEALAADPLPFYVGAGAGWSRVDLDNVGGALPGVSFSTDDNDVGYKLYAGWRALPWLAVEAGWMDVGKATFDGTTRLPATAVRGRYETNAWFIDVVPTFAWDRFAVFAKLGVAFWEAKAGTTAEALVGPQLSASRKERGESFKWGVGGSWDFADRWVARLEYEQFESGDTATGKADASLLSLSVAYRF